MRRLIEYRFVLSLAARRSSEPYRKSAEGVDAVDKSRHIGVKRT